MSKKILNTFLIWTMLTNLACEKLNKNIDNVLENTNSLNCAKLSNSINTMEGSQVKFLNKRNGCNKNLIRGIVIGSFAAILLSFSNMELNSNNHMINDTINNLTNNNNEFNMEQNSEFLENISDIPRNSFSNEAMEKDSLIHKEEIKKEPQVKKQAEKKNVTKEKEKIEKKEERLLSTEDSIKKIITYVSPLSELGNSNGFHQYLGCTQNISVIEFYTNQTMPNLLNMIYEAISPVLCISTSRQVEDFGLSATAKELYAEQALSSKLQEDEKYMPPVLQSPIVQKLMNSVQVPNTGGYIKLNLVSQNGTPIEIYEINTLQLLYKHTDFKDITHFSKGIPNVSIATLPNESQIENYFSCLRSSLITSILYCPYESTIYNNLITTGMIFNTQTFKMNNKYDNRAYMTFFSGGKTVNMKFCPENLCNTNNVVPFFTMEGAANCTLIKNITSVFKNNVVRTVYDAYCNYANSTVVNNIESSVLEERGIDYTYYYCRSSQAYYLVNDIVNGTLIRDSTFPNNTILNITTTSSLKLINSLGLIAFIVLIVN